MEHFWQNIEGFFSTPDFFEAMARIAADEHWSLGVEVGSYLGQSAAFFSVELINAGADMKLHLVDQFDGGRLEKCGENLKPVSNIVTHIIQGDSSAVASFYENASLDFVFIDASHDYAHVRSDIESWRPKVRPGGVLSGHDYCSYDDGNVRFGVIEAVRDAGLGVPITYPGFLHAGQLWPSWSVRC